MYCDKVMAFDLPEPHQPARPFRFYAIMTVWSEADIIAATVKNLYAEGCDRVFVLDNDSDDDTMIRAVAAGAVHHGSFTTEFFSDNIRVDRINEAVREIAAADPQERVWWLYLDADEFPTAPGAQTLRQYLEGLDDRIRCVGSTWINHYPSQKPYWIEGFHPADLQPLAGVLMPRTEFSIWSRYCRQEHVKHQLVRHDAGRPAVDIGLGFHVFHSQEELYEPQGSIWVHHFQFRERAATLDKLARLTAKNDRGFSRHAPKCVWESWSRGERNTSRHQYDHRREIASRMYLPEEHQHLLGFAPLPWVDLVSLLEGDSRWPSVSRWYDETELFSAVERKLPRDSFARWLVQHHHTTKRFEQAVQALRSVVAQSPEDEARLLYLEFDCRLGQGDLPSALGVCRTLAKRHPQSAQARQAMHAVARHTRD
ncbi:MAG: glycosyltransferase family 2 protein [Thermodesulfobacteriota bacterium]